MAVVADAFSESRLECGFMAFRPIYPYLMDLRNALAAVELLRD